MTAENSSSRPGLNQLPSAGVMRRFAAILYDSLLLLAISFSYGALVILLTWLVQGKPPEGQSFQWGDWKFLVFIGWMATLMLFFCYFWHKSGQTLGMRAWRMKLVDKNLAPPGVKQCLTRCLIAPFSLACFGLGYLWLWFDPQKQTLHDRLSNTRVILLPKEKK